MRARNGVKGSSAFCLSPYPMALPDCTAIGWAILCFPPLSVFSPSSTVTLVCASQLCKIELPYLLQKLAAELARPVS
jgi:hypothetical protein